MGTIMECRMRCVDSVVVLIDDKCPEFDNSTACVCETGGHEIHAAGSRDQRTSCLRPTPVIQDERIPAEGK